MSFYDCILTGKCDGNMLERGNVGEGHAENLHNYLDVPPYELLKKHWTLKGLKIV